MVLLVITLHGDVFLRRLASGCEATTNWHSTGRPVEPGSRFGRRAARSLSSADRFGNLRTRQNQIEQEFKMHVSLSSCPRFSILRPGPTFLLTVLMHWIYLVTKSRTIQIQLPRHETCKVSHFCFSDLDPACRTSASNVLVHWLA